MGWRESGIAILANKNKLSDETKRKSDSYARWLEDERSGAHAGSYVDTSDPMYEEFSQQMLHTPSSARRERQELSRQARANLSDGITPLWKRQASAPASFTEELRKMYGRPSGVDYGKNPYNAEWRSNVPRREQPQASFRSVSDDMKARFRQSEDEWNRSGFAELGRTDAAIRYAKMSNKDREALSPTIRSRLEGIYREESKMAEDYAKQTGSSGRGDAYFSSFSDSYGLGLPSLLVRAFGSDTAKQNDLYNELNALNHSVSAGIGDVTGWVMPGGINSAVAKGVEKGLKPVANAAEKGVVKTIAKATGKDAVGLALSKPAAIAARGAQRAASSALTGFGAGAATGAIKSAASGNEAGQVAKDALRQGRDFAVAGAIGGGIGGAIEGSRISRTMNEFAEQYMKAGGDDVWGSINNWYRGVKPSSGVPVTTAKQSAPLRNISSVVNESSNLSGAVNSAATKVRGDLIKPVAENTPVRAGQATTIKNPYSGQTPTQAATAPVDMVTELDDTKTAIARYAEASGRKIEWYTDKSMPEKADANGFYKNGTIYINENAENPQLEVFKHELFHSLNGGDKQAVIGFFRNNVNENTAAFRKYKDETMRANRRKDLRYSEEDFWEEYAAQNAEFLLDESKIEQIAKQDRNLAQRILDAIKAMIKRIRDTFSKPRDYSTDVAGHESGLVSGLTDAQLQNAERLYEKAIQGNVTNHSNKIEPFSIKHGKNGVSFTHIDAPQDIFNGVPVEKMPSVVRKYLVNRFKNQILDVGADKAFFNKRSSEEYAYPAKYLDKNTKEAKMRGATELDNLLSTAREKQHVDDDGRHAEATGGWDYYKTNFVVDLMNEAGNTVPREFEGIVKVMNTDRGRRFYDITQIKEITGSNSGVSGINPLPASSETSSVGISIPQKDTAVNGSIREKEDGDTKSSLKRSKFYDSIQEANTVTQEVKRGAQEAEDDFYYSQISNEETMKKAVSEIAADPHKEATRFLGLIDKDATTEDIAKGFVLLKQYQDNGDYESAIEIAKKLSTVGTEKGRQVQIYSVLGRLTPEGMLKYAVGELEKAKEIIAKAKWGKKWLQGAGRKLDLTPEEVKWITDIMERVQNMTDDRNKAVMLAEIQKKIQSKLPSTFGSKLATLQRISLLLNPKTVISRNALSNVLMNPIFTANEFVASGLDKAMGAKTGIRSTGLPSYSQQFKGMKKGLYESYDDFRRGINTRDVQTGRYDVTNSFGTGPAFKGKRNPIAFLDRLTGYLLETGDRPFSEGYFLESLNGQMKANKVSEPTADMIDIATQTALEKTWQDDNVVTRSANMIRNGLNFGHDFGLGSIIVPFVKTPSNLAKAIVEFSPVGFAKGLTVDAYKTAKAVHNGTITPQQQRRFVNNVSKGITGTIMYVAGLALAGAGLTVGSDDEKDKDIRNFKRNILGISQNAIRLGDGTYQFDWAQPIGSVLTITADIVKNNINVKNAAEIITNALAAGGNTLFEQSMLRGISDFFGNYDGFVTSLARSAIEFPTQLQPTLLKQMAEVIDPVARSTSGTGLLDTASRKMIARAPQATKRLEPVVDVLGRDVMRHGGQNSLFNIFLNPANVNIANPTKETKEIWRLYEETGDKDIFPKIAPNSFSYKGTSYKLTPNEKTMFQRTMGQKTVEELKRLIDSIDYNKPKSSASYRKSKTEDKESLSDDQLRASQVKKVIDDAYEDAKKEMLKGRGVAIEEKEADQ